MERLLGDVIIIAMYVFLYGILPSAFIAYGQANKKTWATVTGLVIWALLISTVLGANTVLLQIIGAVIGTGLVFLAQFKVKPSTGNDAVGVSIVSKTEKSESVEK